MHPVVWILVAVLGVGAVILLMSGRSVFPTTYDQRGMVDNTVKRSPDSQDDALGSSIAGAVDAGFKLASQIFSAVSGGAKSTGPTTPTNTAYSI